MYVLDKYDKKLLYELDVNSRQSYVSISKKIGMSKDAVKYRINNYIENGVIGGFYALINASKLGYHVIRSYFKFRNTNNQKEEEILQYLKSKKNVFAVIRTEVSYDVAVGYWAKKLDDFMQFWSEFRNKYSQYITSETQSIFTKYYRFTRNHLTARITQEYVMMNEPSYEKIDETDIRILEILAKDARAQIIDIARIVKLTPKAVIIRIRDLEKRKIILRYLPKINLEKIGYSIYKVDIKLTNQDKIKEIRENVFNLPNIIESESAVGGSDFEFDIEVQKFEEYEHIMDSLKEKYGEYIESINYYRTLKVYKMVFLPVD